MVAIAENPAEIIKPARTKPIAKDVQANAQAMYIAGIPVEKISAELGVKLNTLWSWIHRKKWTANKRKYSAPIQQATAQIVRDTAESVRDRLGNKLAVAAEVIGDPVDALDLRNQGQGYAAVLKTLAETHKTLYGGAEMNVLVFGVDSMNDRPGSQQISQASEQNSQGVIDVDPGE